MNEAVRQLYIYTFCKTDKGILMGMRKGERLGEQRGIKLGEQRGIENTLLALIEQGHINSDIANKILKEKSKV